MSTRRPRPAWRDLPAAPMVAAAATVVCLALLLHRLGDKSYWADETFSIGTVDRPFGDALRRLATWEVNQSPYLFLLFWWLRLSDSQWFLNLLSVAFAVATVPLVYRIGVRAGGRRTGAVAAVFVAVHPMTLEYGQHLRAYSMAMCMAALTTLLLLRLVEQPGTGRALTYGVAAALACYVHFYLGLTVLAHGLAAGPLALRRAALRRPLALAVGAAVVLTVPLAHYFVTREGDPLYWVSRSGAIVPATVRRLAGGDAAGTTLYGGLLVAALVPWAAAGRAVSRRATRRWPEVLLWSALVVPFAVATAVTFAVKPVLESKFLIGTVPALAVLAAIGAGRLPRRWLGAAAVVLLCAVSLRRDVAFYDADPIDDWRGATAAVVAGVHEAALAGRSAAVLAVPVREGNHALRYYVGQLGAPEIVPWSTGDPAPDVDEVWVVTRPLTPATRAEDRIAAAWLDGYRPASRQEFIRLVVERYERAGG